MIEGGTSALAGAGRINSDSCETLVELISSGAARNGTIEFPESKLSSSWHCVNAEAERWASALQSLGAGPGCRIALLANMSVDMVTAIEAIWLSGSTLVVLPIPTRSSSIESFTAEMVARVIAVEAFVLIVGPEYSAFDFRSHTAIRGGAITKSFDEMAREARLARRWRMPCLDSSDVAVLQFTSGSTGDPKGVLISHRNVVANILAIAEAIEIDPGADVTMSWLPLFHDMGLFGFLALPMSLGNRAVYADPSAFLANPRMWLEWISEFRATLTAGPNVAYAIAQRAAAGGSELNLSCLQWALNASEPIVSSVIEGFEQATQRHHLLPGVLSSGYGLAEATLAVTLRSRGSGVGFDCVQRSELEQNGIAIVGEPQSEGTRLLARLGTSVPGASIKVVDSSGESLPDRRVGRVFVSGPSVSTGYTSDGRVGSAPILSDGWLDTGDQGYMAEGELVLCGRLKDVLFVGGRNVFPNDIECLVEGIEGIRPGNVVAVGSDGFEGPARIVVVAEHRSKDPAGLKLAVRERVRDHMGLRVDGVVLLQPGELPKTSSGKVQRATVAEKFL